MPSTTTYLFSTVSFYVVFGRGVMLSLWCLTVLVLTAVLHINVV